ncbi:MAG: DUF922 domain-containing protein [Vicingaceae bacterium]
MRDWLFCILMFSFGFAGIAQEDKISTNRIIWNDWYRLEWTDFEAKAEEDSKIAALSSIGLPYEYVTDGEGMLTITINVCFFKNESWSKESNQNKVLLQHEQLHFDIAELHRRMIVKELMKAEFTKNNYEQKLDEIVNEYWSNSYRQMQDKYDKETNFSRVFQAQINWNRFVSQQLRNLEEYAFTEIEVSLINFD